MLLSIATYGQAAPQARSSRLHRVIARFGEALRLGPRAGRAWRAEDRSGRGPRDLKDVLADYTEAIGRDPNNSAAYRGRGITYLKHGGYLRTGGYVTVRRQRCFDRAVADFTAVVRLKPDDAAAFAWRATAYEVQGEKEKAQADRAKAKELTSRCELIRCPADPTK